MDNKEQEGEWVYIGDVNLEYGGTFFRFDPYYVEAVRVTDLDGACGAHGLTLIEKLTVFGMDDKDKICQALECCGTSISDLRGKGKAAIMIELAYCLMSYGFYDLDGGYYNYQKPSHWVIVNSDYGPLSNKRNWESWKPNKEETVLLHHKYGGDLEQYINDEVLD